MVSPPGKSGYTRWSPKKKAEEGFSMKAAGGGVLTAVALAVALALLASGVVYVTSLDERILSWVVDAGSFVILGFSSFIIARRQERFGLAYGLAIGGCYAVASLVIGGLLFPPFPGVGAFIRRLGFSLVAGACGGIFGVNS